MKYLKKIKGMRFNTASNIHEQASKLLATESFDISNEWTNLE
jgi:hypothetical protein